jgi:hypothetical protein
MVEQIVIMKYLIALVVLLLFFPVVGAQESLLFSLSYGTSSDGVTDMPFCVVLPSLSGSVSKVYFPLENFVTASLDYSLVEITAHDGTATIDNILLFKNYNEINVSSYPPIILIPSKTYAVCLNGTYPSPLEPIWFTSDYYYSGMDTRWTPELTGHTCMTGYSCPIYAGQTLIYLWRVDSPAVWLYSGYPTTTTTTVPRGCKVMDCSFLTGFPMIIIGFLCSAANFFFCFPVLLGILIVLFVVYKKLKKK